MATVDTVEAPTDLIRGHMVQSLDRVVAGLIAFVLDFDGPATAYIGTEHRTSYVTLCSHGIKAEGETPLYFGWQEAIEKYEEQFRTMLAANKDKHLAWRMRPRIEAKEFGKYCVRSRLAFI